MKTLKKGARKAAQLGYKHGTSAADWHKADPMAAAAFADWLDENRAALVKEMADKLCAS